MPRLSAMSVCDISWSRRRRRRRWPRKSLADIGEFLSTSHRVHKSSCDKRTLFAGASSPPSVLQCDIEITRQRRKQCMTSFDQIVVAPPGRFEGISRPYDVAEVLRLRGSVAVEHTLARRGALKL